MNNKIFVYLFCRANMVYEALKKNQATKFQVKLIPAMSFPVNNHLL